MTGAASVALTCCAADLLCACRLHRHVYDRLAAAQRCARDKNQPQFRQTGDEHRKEPDPQVCVGWLGAMVVAALLASG